MAKDIKELLGELYTEAIGAKFDGYHVIVPENYVPKTVFNEKNELAKLAEQQRADYEKKLAEFSKSVEGNEELKQAIADLKKANNEQKLEYEKNIYTSKLNNKLDLIIAGAGAKDSKLVRTLLDSEIIKLDGDTVIGVNEQLEKVKASHPYLFGETKIVGSKPERGASPTALTEKAKLIDKYNKSTNATEKFRLNEELQKLE